MRFASIIWYLLLDACLAGWVTNPVTPSVLNVTPDIKTEDLRYLSAFYTLSSGEPHIMLGFNGSYAQAWDVNLSNGTSVVFTMTNDVWGFGETASHGAPGIQAILTFSNTLLVCSTAQHSNQVWEFVPANSTSTMILTNSETAVSSMCRAPDGEIFMGSYGHVYLDSWNPSNRAFKPWGLIDSRLVGPTNVGNYCYYVVADAGYVYCAIRGAIPDWYMVVIDRATEERSFWWTNGTGSDTSDVTLYEGTNGYLYAASTTNGFRNYWRLTNGTPVSLGSLPACLDPYYDEPGVDRDLDNWNTQTGWEFDINETLYSINGSVSSATIRWKRTNDVTWNTVTETNNWQPVAASFDILQPWIDSNLVWVTRAYGPVGLFSPGGITNVLGAYKRQSTRDLLRVSETEVYLSGYHLTTIRWNPSESWTRTPSLTDFTDSAYNPYTIDETGGIYHCFMVRGADGRIFTASHYDRNGTGGGLAWYNPTTEVKGLEHTTFIATADSPTDLKPAENATKLVWCSWGGNVFVWDVSTFTQLTNFTVLSGARIDKCVEYENGKMFGIAGSNTVGFSTSGNLLWSNSLPANVYSTTAFTTHYTRLTLGPDGFVWVPSGTKLYRVNSANGNYNAVVTITAGPDKVAFNGGDAYLYGGSTIWELNDMLISSTNVNCVGNYQLSGNVTIQ